MRVVYKPNINLRTNSNQNYHNLEIARGSQAATVRSQTSHGKVTIYHRGATGGPQKGHRNATVSHGKATTGQRRDTDRPQLTTEGTQKGRRNATIGHKRATETACDWLKTGHSLQIGSFSKIFLK